MYRLAGGSPYLYPTIFGGPNTARMLINYQTGRAVGYQNLEQFVPFTDGRYYDILVFAIQDGVIEYDFSKESLKNDIQGCKKAFVYYENGDRIYDVSGKGILVVRLFYYQEKDDNRTYAQIVQELKKKIQIRNTLGENVTMIRIPENLHQKRIFEL